jgi:hypothetical protein
MKEREEKQTEIASEHPETCNKKVQREQNLQFTFQLLENKVILFTKENSGCAQNQKFFIKVFGQHPLCTRV